MHITSAGVDLAKDVFSVCAMGEHRAIDQRQLRRESMRQWLSHLPPRTVVGMEACGTSHYWAREMAGLGLQPRIMAAEFVAPYRKSRAMKNDRNDAEAIALAVMSPGMRFVAVKTLDQQGRLALHRMREGWKEERTAMVNRLRGLLMEFGLVYPRSTAALRKGLALAVHDQQLPASVRELAGWAREDLQRLDERIASCDRAIGMACRSDPAARRLQELMGVGPTSADAEPG